MWKLLALTIFIVGAFGAETPINTPQAQPAQQPVQPPPVKPNPIEAQQGLTQQQAQPSQPPAAGVKNLTAGGKYHDHGGRYEHGHHNYGHRIFRGYDVPLIDDYICDLDATILVVTNSDDYGHGHGGHDYGRSKRNAYGGHGGDYGRDTYGGGSSKDYGSHYGGHDDYNSKDKYGSSGRDHHYGNHHGYENHQKHDYGHNDYEGHHEHGYGVSANADRLRCSIIANWDKKACERCCRLSARRDRSISKHKIIGFLVDNNQLNYDPPTGGEGYGDHRGDGYSDRKKRSDTYSQPAYSAPVEAPESYGDYRCVCCAPKRYRPHIFDRYFRRHGHGYGHHRGGYGHDGGY